MEALSYIPTEAKILACPEDSVSAFAALAEEAGFSLLPGPKEDVLARYCLAIHQSGADRILRATADNPFVFVDAAIALNREAISLIADYACYFGLPCGAGVESTIALKLSVSTGPSPLRNGRARLSESPLIPGKTMSGRWFFTSICLPCPLRNRAKEKISLPPTGNSLLEKAHE
jgi:hypothetical protein